MDSNSKEGERFSSVCERIEDIFVYIYFDNTVYKKCSQNS